MHDELFVVRRPGETVAAKWPIAVGEWHSQFNGGFDQPRFDQLSVEIPEAGIVRVNEIDLARRLELVSQPGLRRRDRSCHFRGR